MFLEFNLDIYILISSYQNKWSKQTFLLNRHQNSNKEAFLEVSREQILWKILPDNNPNSNGTQLSWPFSWGCKLMSTKLKLLTTLH